MPMSLALSTYVLFSLLMQSVNGTQFLVLLFASALWAVVFPIDVVLLTSIYASR